MVENGLDFTLLKGSQTTFYVAIGRLRTSNVVLAEESTQMPLSSYLQHRSDSEYIQLREYADPVYTR